MVLALSASLSPTGAETVKLTYDDASAVAKTITPGFVKNNCPGVEGRVGSNYVTIADERIPLKFGKRGRVSFVGADCDGDGKIGAKEIQPIAGGVARLEVKVDGSPFALLLQECRIYTRNGKITSVWGRAQPACRRKGTLNGVCIGLLDTNLDGKITQDGSDAICIGTSPMAQPLRKVHLIGGTHYRLVVAEDGKSIGCQPVTGEQLALVDFPLKTRALKTLVVTSEDGKIYDLVSAAKTGLLPGTYKLDYGLLVSGKHVVPIRPTKSARSYELKGGKKNTLRLGAPVRMRFGASYSNSKITVGGYIYPLGDGGEKYVVSLGAGDGVPAPQIGFYEGKRKLDGGRMGYG
jgi:hypothetical protein